MALSGHALQWIGDSLICVDLKITAMDQPWSLSDSNAPELDWTGSASTVCPEIGRPHGKLTAQVNA
jgi:hypothetical protein